METERIKNSKYNIIFNFIQIFLTTILSFIVRYIFINILGKELLGLDGLLTNILSMLSLTNLGIDTAINFSLYKPISENDNAKISALMTLYKKIYFIIAFVILIFGLLLMPFLPLLINGYKFDNLYLIYILYLVYTVFSYLYIYKETLITAYQKNYRLFVVKSITTIMLYGLQIVTLILTRNFILYLIITFIVKLLQNFLISYYVTKKYPEIDYNAKERINEETRKNIISNVKSLFVTRVGDYLLNGTDNILISIINIGLTGIYANYLSITGVAKTFMNVIYNGIVASFGNLVALESKKIQENVFNISNFTCFAISGFVTIELIFLLNPFISFWVGKKYLLDFWIVVIISLNYYLFSQILSLDVIKRATGLYKIDAHISIIQAIVNLLVSIIFGHLIGIGGIIIGTFASYIFVACIFKPKLIYKNIFGKSANSYYIEQLKYLIFIIFVSLLLYFIILFINIDISLLNIILKGIIIAVVYLVTLVLVFKNNYNFNYMYKNFIEKFIIKK